MILHAPLSATRRFLSDTSASVTIWALFNLVLVLFFAGLALESVPPYVSMAAYFLLFFGHCLFVMKAEDIARRLRPSIQGNALTQE